MQSKILPLLHNEFVKLAHRKLPWLGVLGVGLVCLSVYHFTSGVEGRDTLNAWGFIGFSMQAGFTDVGLIFIAIFAATLLADETGAGTIKIMLTQPLTRKEFLLGKVFVGLAYMLFLSGMALAFSFLLGGMKYSFGDIADPSGLIYTQKTVIYNLTLAFILSWFPLATVVFFGLFISSLTKASGQAIGAAVGVLVLVETGKHFIDFGPYVFTTYINAPWVIFHEITQGVSYTWRPEIWKLLGVSTLYSVVFFSLSLIIFCKRDMN
jgi:ABC-type transport system involved in multi-copper enzyme maturation permease subunit